ncbi:hypothetical protein MRX96_006483 [Rhipicephalus microplus]
MAADDKLSKHPLQHRWSMWYFKNDKKCSWEDNHIEITSFDTVEDFWALFNYLEVASKLRLGCDYSLFKYGIKPMWEDGRNENGGRWLFSLNKSQRNTDLDNYWLEILLCLIGEGFDEEISDDVNGVVVQVRPKFDKVAVWTADVHRAGNNIRIGSVHIDSPDGKLVELGTHLHHCAIHIVADLLEALSYQAQQLRRSGETTYGGDQRKLITKNSRERSRHRALMQCLDELVSEFPIDRSIYKTKLSQLKRSIAYFYYLEDTVQVICKQRDIPLPLDYQILSNRSCLSEGNCQCRIALAKKEHDYAQTTDGKSYDTKVPYINSPPDILSSLERETEERER